MEYRDEQTQINMTVDPNNPKYPGHPLITITFPVKEQVPLEEINPAVGRLRTQAGLTVGDFPDPIFTEWMKAAATYENMYDYEIIRELLQKFIE